MYFATNSWLWDIHEEFLEAPIKHTLLLVREVFKIPISTVVQHNQRRGATLSLVGGLHYPDCTGPSTNCEKLVKQNQYFLTVY